MEGKTMYAVPATHAGVEGHKMFLLLVRKVDLEGKEIYLTVPSQDVSQEVVVD